MSAKYMEINSIYSKNEIKAVIGLIGLTQKEDEYKALVNSRLAATPNYNLNKESLEAGCFDGHDFFFLVSALMNDVNVRLDAITRMLTNLCNAGVVMDRKLFDRYGPKPRYFWKKDAIKSLTELGIIDNLMLGPSHIVQKYQASVPPIFVEKDGDKNIGTGFLTIGNTEFSDHVVVTAKHVIDPAEGNMFLSFGTPKGTTYKPLRDEWYFHTKLDLAAMPVTISGNPIPIFPHGSAPVFSKTITLGYPHVARTKEAYLLAHAGELNAVVETYHNEPRLLISNMVAPGNSGGPILDEAGLCIGMVTDALEAKHNKDSYNVNAALPAHVIREFLLSLKAT
ncbi:MULTISPECIES: serine protease [unclassified Roseovarius]|uniref:S1 family peptidase n=1 Tax=unclassified Roseovarius TaxID=2614913 RepID=UPI00273DB410|nr:MULTISPECIES: serine protease [unclassified Roseovarius]